MSSMIFGNITQHAANTNWQDGYENGAAAESANSTQKAPHWAVAEFFTGELLALLIATTAMALS